MVAGDRYRQLVRNLAQQGFGPEGRIAEIKCIHAVWQTLDEHPAEHGLAAAHLAAHLDDPFVVEDRINQCVEGGATTRTCKEELCMWSDPEWWLVEAVVVEVHAFLLQFSVD